MKELPLTRLIAICNDKERKFLQINILLNSRSTGHIVEEIGAIVMKNGWEIYIALFRFERPGKSILIIIRTDIKTII